MSKEYNDYILEHKANVTRAFEWIEEKLPRYVTQTKFEDLRWQITLNHDESKKTQDEYTAYDEYFYGNNRAFLVVENFNKAWLHHIHNNPYHWQCWVLLEDDPEGGSMVMKEIDMPYNYIIEMVCDWWSFSWKNGDLYSIFYWYREHKETMKLSYDTRSVVESLLRDIKIKLDGGKNEQV